MNTLCPGLHKTSQYNGTTHATRHRNWRMSGIFFEEFGLQPDHLFRIPWGNAITQMVNRIKISTFGINRVHRTRLRINGLA